MKLWNNPVWVARTPVLTVGLLEGANVGQLWRMWTQHSALGQNVWSWLSVNIALWLWLNFYRVNVPGGLKSWAARATFAGILLNGAVIVSVAILR